MFWWADWEFRDVEWTLPKYLYTMITPIFMFYAIALIIPAPVHEKEMIPEEHLTRTRVTVIWSLFIALITQLLDGPILAGEPW
jgi:hypothetical protein